MFSEKKFQEERKMKKKFKMVDLDCANCAAKMEDAIKKIDGVNDATVSFMMQKHAGSRCCMQEGRAGLPDSAVKPEKV